MLPPRCDDLHVTVASFAYACVVDLVIFKNPYLIDDHLLLADVLFHSVKVGTHESRLASIHEATT